MMDGHEKVDTSDGTYNIGPDDKFRTLAGLFVDDQASLPWRTMIAKGHAELWRPVPPVEVLAGNKKYRLFRTPEGFRFERFAGGRWWVEIIGMFPDFAAEEILTLRARIAELEAQRPLEVGDTVVVKSHEEPRQKFKITGMVALLSGEGLNYFPEYETHQLTRIEAQP